MPDGQIFKVSGTAERSRVKLIVTSSPFLGDIQRCARVRDVRACYRSLKRWKTYDLTSLKDVQRCRSHATKS